MTQFANRFTAAVVAVMIAATSFAAITTVPVQPMVAAVVAPMLA